MVFVAQNKHFACKMRVNRIGVKQRLLKKKCFMFWINKCNIALFLCNKQTNTEREKSCLRY